MATSMVGKEELIDTTGVLRSGVVKSPFIAVFKLFNNGFDRVVFAYSLSTEHGPRIVHILPCNQNLAVFLMEL